MNSWRMYLLDAERALIAATEALPHEPKFTNARKDAYDALLSTQSALEWLSTKSMRESGDS